VLLDAAMLKTYVLAMVFKGGPAAPKPEPFPPGKAARPPRASYIAAKREEGSAMCRNIRTLFNFKPPATEDEIQASALQFVRKLSGFNRPSKANEEAFNRAVAEVAHAARHLIDALVTTAPPRDREVEAEKARARSAQRFGRTAA
jgi:hypothetical protein